MSPLGGKQKIVSPVMIFFRYGRKFKFGKRTEPVKENNGGFCIFRTKQPSVQAETVTAFNKNILRRQMFYKISAFAYFGKIFFIYVKRFCAVFRKNIRKLRWMPVLLLKDLE